MLSINIDLSDFFEGHPSCNAILVFRTSPGSWGRWCSSWPPYQREHALHRYCFWDLERCSTDVPSDLLAMTAAFGVAISSGITLVVCTHQLPPWFPWTYRLVARSSFRGLSKAKLLHEMPPKRNVVRDAQLATLVPTLNSKQWASATTRRTYLRRLPSSQTLTSNYKIFHMMKDTLPSGKKKKGFSLQICLLPRKVGRLNWLKEIFRFTTWECQTWIQWFRTSPLQLVGRYLLVVMRVSNAKTDLVYARSTEGRRLTFRPRV